VTGSAARWLALVLGLALAAPAAAHETLHEIRRGQAIALKASFADGEVLAYTPFEVYSPADPKLPWLKGRTDRAGWLAFLPDVPGRWRVKVIESTGHGLDLEVDATAGAGETGGAPAAGSLAFVLRPLLGLAVIALVFAALTLAWRKKEQRP
jgi:nickel transport protein